VLARASLWQTGIPTWSFSTIAATPRVPFASKVSMEWSRCPDLYEPPFHSRVFCHVRKAPLGLRGWSRIAHSRTRRTALGAQVSRRPRPLWDCIVKVGETYCRFAQKKLPKWLVAWRIQGGVAVVWPTHLGSLCGGIYRVQDCRVLQIARKGER
jgi:hypothetical protein